MKKLILLICFVALAAGCWGAAPRLYLVTEPKGWKSVEYLEAGRPPAFPTIRYKPTDGRNAEVLITFFGQPPRAMDMAILRQLHDGGCEKIFGAPAGSFETKPIKLLHGQGLVSVFEDPKLIGKPPVREDYKFTTAVDILFDSGEFAHATLFADERTGKTATEEMQIMQSCDLHPKAVALRDPAMEDSGDFHFITVPGLDAMLGIPKEGLQESPLNANSSENYFSFIRSDGMDLSGWMEPVEKYGGFRKVWSTDKGKMERGMGAKIQNETFLTINGWEAVFYTLKMGNVEQPNLRACRVAGNTWLDVHLSTMNKTGSTAAFKKLLQSLTVQLPNEPDASASPVPANPPH